MTNAELISMVRSIAKHGADWRINEVLNSAADALEADEKRIAELMPTVDAVPVVRCKECKWAKVDAWWTYCKLGHKEDTTNSILYTCTHDFFCADGEREKR